jgi:hypothetical protein
VVGLAAAALAGLLFCLSRGTPAVQAAAGEVGPAWTSMEPISKRIGEHATIWPIPQHGVTLTFKGDTLTWPAWFTFTPQLPSVLPAPYITTPYFFRLWGTYAGGSSPVSLGASGIEVELAYEMSRLEIDDPQRLEAFYRRGGWTPLGAQVDADAATLTFKAAVIGEYGVGGEGPKVFLPLAVSN